MWKRASGGIKGNVPTSQSASTNQNRFGNLFRRNMPYGTATRHGAMFVGFSAEQQRLTRVRRKLWSIDFLRVTPAKAHCCSGYFRLLN
jgi:hypothetical protein